MITNLVNFPIVINIRDNYKNAVLIDRNTKYGNPYLLNKDGDRDTVCDLYGEYALFRLKQQPNWLDNLAGKSLRCHCAPKRCHGETLIRLANDNPDPIFFNSQHGTYNWLSNFYISNFIIDGIIYQSVENYYQSQKTFDSNARNKIINATPNKAKGLGNGVTKIKDFDDNKLAIMEKAIYNKFKQNEDLLIKLIDTKYTLLYEFAPWDRGNSYWGINGKGIGENHCGKIIMLVRNKLIRELTGLS